MSSSMDWIREIWTPISLWIPEHSMHVKMPRLVDNHLGSLAKLGKLWLVTCNSLLSHKVEHESTFGYFSALTKDIS